MRPHKTATVVISNNTGKKLQSVTVYHRYSSQNKKNLYTFNGVHAGSTSNDTMKINYRTDALEKGLSWWKVCYETSDGEKQITWPGNPRNGYGFHHHKNGISFHTSTEGFQRHVLSSEDQNDPTVIIINNHSIQFVSRSGTSTTNTIPNHWEEY